MPDVSSKSYRTCLQQLVAYTRPLGELDSGLPRIGNPYSGKPVELQRKHIRNMLAKYASGKITSVEIHGWAELLEMRDGLEFESGHAEMLIQTIHVLANPLLEGALTPARARSILERLRRIPRALRDEERAIVEAMLAATPYASRFIPLDRSLLVYEMDDGGMGSLRFAFDAPEDPRFGKEIAGANYVDADGVLVSIAINLDEHGRLFELDVWKVDNAPLKRWPRPEDLKAEGPATATER